MYLAGPRAGSEFRRRINEGRLLPLIGVYDVYSALIAARRFEGVFCSGYSYAASTYGLPDVGYVNWRDITDFATKIRPNKDLVFDFDGLKVVIDKRSIEFLKGAVLDWEQSLMSYGFKWKNPNAIGDCGCGESFEVA